VAVPGLLVGARDLQAGLPVAGVWVGAPVVQAGLVGVEREGHRPVEFVAFGAGCAGRPDGFEDLDGKAAAVWLGVDPLVGGLDGLAELIADGVALGRYAAVEHDRVEKAVGDGLAIGLDAILGVVAEEEWANHAVGAHTGVQVVPQGRVIGQDER
jgi:hypothetical protein